MVTFNADTIMAKAIQDVGAAAKAFNERLETKEAIKRLERKMEAIAKLEPLSKQIIRGIKNAQRTILNQFIKEVKLDLYQKSTLKRIADEDLRKILRTLKLPREIESSELRNILREALVKSIELTIGKEFKLSYHA